MASRFWVGGTGTWDATDTTHWSTATGGAGGASVPTSADTAQFDANSDGGTVTVDFGGTITLISLTMGNFGGTWDNSVNNNNFILTGNGAAFNCSGSGTRTIRLGTATYTLTNASCSIGFSTTANLTLVGSSCNWVFSGGNDSVTFNAGGSQSHGNVTFGASSSPGFCSVTGSNITFASVNITAPNYVLFPASTITITAPLAWAGTSSAQIFFLSSVSGSLATIATAANSAMGWVALRDLSFANSPVATSSFSMGNVTGVTLSAPQSQTPVMVGS